MDDKSKPPPRKRPRSFPRLGLVLPVAVVIASAVSLLMVAVLRVGREPTLLQRATRVADVRGWGNPGRWGGQNAPNEVEYHWLTSEALTYWSPPSLHKPQWQPVRLDLRTGLTQPISVRGTGFGLPSPDGKWLLNWKGRGRRINDAADVFAAKLDSSGQVASAPRVVWASTGLAGQIFWLPDSSGWVRLTWTGNQGRAEVFSLAGRAAARPDRTVAFDGRQQPPFRPSGRTNGAPSLWGMSAAGTALAFTQDFSTVVIGAPLRAKRFIQLTFQWKSLSSRGYSTTMAPADRLDVLEWQPLVTGVPPRRRPITVPPGLSKAHLSLSARGDGLAWLGEENYLPPYQDWLGQHFSWFRFRPRRTITLWTTDLYGGGARRVGRLRLPVEATAAPGSLRWVPGSDRVSFIYDGALWTVPAQ